MIYFWWDAGNEVWLFTLYDNDKMDELDSTEKGVLREMLKMELDARQ